MGRPRGSKNKPKNLAENSPPEERLRRRQVLQGAAALGSPGEPKRRGRPPGSKNQPKVEVDKVVSEVAKPVEAEFLRRGRPPGTKNRPKPSTTGGTGEFMPGDDVLIDGKIKATYIRVYTYMHSEVQFTSDPTGMFRTLATHRLSLSKEGP